jgi:hypothetical protein
MCAGVHAETGEWHQRAHPGAAESHGDGTTVVEAEDTPGIIGTSSVDEVQTVTHGE